MAEQAHPLDQTVEELRQQVERDRMIVAELRASPDRSHLLSTAILMLEASVGRLKAAEQNLRTGRADAPAEGLQSPPAPLGQHESGISVGASPGMPETE